MQNEQQEAGSTVSARKHERLKVLSCCGSAVHETCLCEKINDAMTNSHSSIAKIACPHPSCGKRVFKGLCRSIRKGTKAERKASLKGGEGEGVIVGDSPRRLMLMSMCPSVKGLSAHPHPALALPELNVSSISIVQPPQHTQVRVMRTADLRGKRKPSGGRRHIPPLLTASGSSEPGPGAIAIAVELTGT